MARSHGVVKVTVWAPGSEFRDLSKGAQRCYVMLLSQPQINNCGVLPYTPQRWARYAHDETMATLTGDLGELARAKFIVVDEDTAELLVRTFVKHDKIKDQPNLEKAAKREFGNVESAHLRGVLEDLYPWLVEGVPEGVSDGAKEGVNAGARAGTPAAPSPEPTPTPEPSPAPTPKLKTAEQTVLHDVAAALPEEESLEELGQRLEARSAGNNSGDADSPVSAASSEIGAEGSVGPAAPPNIRAPYGSVDSVYEVIDKPAGNTRRELEKWLPQLAPNQVEHVREQTLACEPRKSKAAYAVGTAQKLARERGAA